METLEKVDDDRRCWRLVTNVLVEKKKSEVIPELKSYVENIDKVKEQLGETFVAKKEARAKLQADYGHLLKTHDGGQQQGEQGVQASASGVLV